MSGDPKLFVKALSQLDPGGAARSVHDDFKQANRQIDVKDYDTLNIVYDSDGNMSQVSYYQDRDYSKYDLGFVGDTAGSLNDTYWLLNAAKDRKKYYVWYNVDGGGTDPNISGRVGIEVGISANDAGSIVALAVKQILVLSHSDEFTVSRENAVLSLTALTRGSLTDPVDVSSGLISTTVYEGTEVLLREVYLNYDASGCLLSYDKVELNVKC
jgi:hypothetical protein